MTILAYQASDQVMEYNRKQEDKDNLRQLQTIEIDENIRCHSMGIFEIIIFDKLGAYCVSIVGPRNERSDSILDVLMRLNILLQECRRRMAKTEDSY